MDSRQNYYIEITTRIRAGRGFCEFLASGGTVWDQPRGADWRNVTSEMIARERRKVEELERIRSRLYPEFADDDMSPPLYEN